MLNKKIKSIIFIFLILFCISAVNAESSDEFAAADSNVSNMEIEVNIMDMNAESFSDLNDLVYSDNESEISLEKNPACNSTTDQSFVTGIIMNKNLSIDCKGNDVKGSSLAGIFYATARSFTVKNINLVSGATSASGSNSNDGATYGMANVTATNAMLISNLASNNMDAISVVSTNAALQFLKVVDSTFINNKASAEDGGMGGMNFPVMTSKFLKNIAKDSGAVVDQSISALNSTFVNNTATGLSGALASYFYDVLGPVFMGNAAVNGGIIHNSLGPIIDSVFANNMPTNGKTIYSISNNYNRAYDQYHDLLDTLNFEDVKKELEDVKDSNYTEYLEIMKRVEEMISTYESYLNVSLTV